MEFGWFRLYVVGWVLAIQLCARFTAAGAWSEVSGQDINGIMEGWTMQVRWLGLGLGLWRWL